MMTMLEKKDKDLPWKNTVQQADQTENTDLLVAASSWEIFMLQFSLSLHWDNKTESLP